jgi:CheY-like chemotaxis protein
VKMSLNKKTILVVEDNTAAAKSAKFIFELLGCQVEQVDDGDKAINMVKSHQYDGICMDIGLPTVSGTKACLAIREYEAKNHLSPVPIVAVTGNCSPEEIKEYLEAGMQDVIDKPLTKDKAEHLLSFCKQ